MDEFKRTIDEIYRQLCNIWNCILAAGAVYIMYQSVTNVELFNQLYTYPIYEFLQKYVLIHF